MKKQKDEDAVGKIAVLNQALGTLEVQTGKENTPSGQPCKGESILIGEPAVGVTMRKRKTKAAAVATGTE